MSTYVKYPKTFHIPTSPNLQNDDRRIDSMDNFIGKRVIVSIKCDGENTNFYRDHIHARSVDSKDHLSRHWVKGFHAGIKRDIPEGWRICGENCYALHSIYYNKLPSYFLAFGIYDENNVCLSWDETKEFCELLDIHTVPVIYDGIYDAEKIQQAYDDNFVLGGWQPKEDIDYFDVVYGEYQDKLLEVEPTWHGLTGHGFDNFRDLIAKGYDKDIEKFANPIEEGYVIRLAQKFDYNDFQKSCAKFVRRGHVHCSDHWMSEPVIPNKLKL